MEIIFTERFEQAYDRLTAAGRQSVRKALTLLADNPGYPDEKWGHVHFSRGERIGHDPRLRSGQALYRAT